MFTGLLSHNRWKDNVACGNEQREGHKTSGNNISGTEICHKIKGGESAKRGNFSAIAMIFGVYFMDLINFFYNIKNQYIGK
ncbi:MAG: hypothetical protein JNJ93_07390 [Acinetobacter sp.]|nr:hypothetical protein [Acinetobacter sp.]